MYNFIPKPDTFPHKKVQRKISCTFLSVLVKAMSYPRPISSGTSPAPPPPLVPPSLGPGAGIPGIGYCPAPQGPSSGLPGQPGRREEFGIPPQARRECLPVTCLQLKLEHEPHCRKTNDLVFAPISNSTSQIRVFAAHMKIAHVLSYQLSTKRDQSPL